MQHACMKLFFAHPIFFCYLCVLGIRVVPVTVACSGK